MLQIIRKHKKSLIIFLFFGIMIVPFISFSQSKIDSLKDSYASTKTDSGKVTLLNSIGYAYYTTYKADSLSTAFTYSREGLKLAKNINDAKKAAETMYTIGFLYWAEGNNDSAIFCIKQAANYFDALPSSKEGIKIHKMLGDVYRDATQYPLATDAYAKALDIARSLKDSVNMQLIYYNEALMYDLTDQYELAREQAKKAVDISLLTKQYRAVIRAYNVIGSTYAKQSSNSAAATAYFNALEINEKYLHDDDVTGVLTVNLGNVYEGMKDSANAMKYYRQSLAIFTKENKKVNMAQVLGNMGNVYMDAGDYKIAEQYEIKSLDVMKQMGDNYYTALCYTNVAEFYNDTKQYDKAEAYYNYALGLQENRNDKEGMVFTLSGIGELNKNKGNYAKALEYDLKSYNDAVEIKLTGQVRDQAKNLSEIYDKLHQPDKAFFYYKQYISVRDSIENKAEAKKLINAELSHEFEQKQQAEKLEDEKQKAIADEREKRNGIIRNVYLVGFVIVLFFTGLLLRNLLRIRKSNQIITEQKLEVEKQKMIVEEKNKDITDSIKYASRIQRALLTTHEYIGRQVKENFIFFKPRDIVSGDFYWAFATGSPGRTGTFYLACCDCTGHGVPGAFMSLLNISMLNESIIERKTLRPDFVLNEIRDSIIKALNPEKADTESKDGMDCALCAIDFTNNTMQLACANNPVWIVKAGASSLIEIEPDKMPVGIQYGDQKPFTLNSVKLNEGDCIYMFTDGYADQFGGPKGKKFKYKQLQDIVMANAGRPMSEQKEILEKTFGEWMGGLEQVDDVLVIGIKV